MTSYESYYWLMTKWPRTMMDNLRDSSICHARPHNADYWSGYGQNVAGRDIEEMISPETSIIYII